MKSFPQPLTAAEEKYYMQKYTEGDLGSKAHSDSNGICGWLPIFVKKYQPPPGGDGRPSRLIGTIGLMKPLL